MSHTPNWQVLIVEDEPDGREVVSGILNYLNIATMAVGTAEEAIDLLRYDRYNAAVIDLALPEMDGMELLQVIRNNPDTANLPCIAITAYHTSLVKQQSLDTGFDAYLPKPLDNAALVQELDRLLSG